jgi:hypothetical protein
MWQFTGLATATYDVKVTAPGAGLVKWYKGLVDIGIVATLAGQITTTEILDGTIKTADLEANAVTQIAKSTAVFAGPSYGGAPPQLIPEMSVSMAVPVANAPVLVLWDMTVASSVAGTHMIIDLRVDTVLVVRRELHSIAAGAFMSASCLYLAPALSAGTHTAEVFWWVNTGGGTMSSPGGSRDLLLLQLKR